MYENFLAYARIWFKANKWQAIAIAISFLVIGLAIGAPANAATNLAIISISGAQAGDPFDARTATAEKYDVPKATDLVRRTNNGSDFVWAVFSTLTTTDKLDSCLTDIPAGTAVPNPWGEDEDSCKAWSLITAIQASAAGGVLWVNSTGNLALKWDKPVFDANAVAEAQLTGYKLYSGTYQGALTLLRTLPVTPLTLALPGYANGKYSFALSAVYGAVESPQTGPVSVEVRIPTVPKSARAPAQFGVE